jgi:hypothetical protein
MTPASRFTDNILILIITIIIADLTADIDNQLIGEYAQVNWVNITFEEVAGHMRESRSGL